MAAPAIPWLDCWITEPDETVARGRVLAQLHTNIEKLEAERQEVLAGFNERLEDLRREVRRRSGDLVAGAETRMLAVLDTFDFGEATVTTARKDSGAILEKREMTPEERQLGLDLLMQGAGAQARYRPSSARTAEIRRTVAGTIPSTALNAPSSGTRPGNSSGN